jgi:hypothetical protein
MKKHFPCTSVCFLLVFRVIPVEKTAWTLHFPISQLQTRRWPVLVKTAIVVERPRQTRQGRNEKHQQESLTFPIAELDELAADTWQRRNFEE